MCGIVPKRHTLCMSDVGNGVPVDLPARLSPSRLGDFRQCPAKFYYGSILKLPRQATEATTIGTLAHEAFEKVFDHPREERTVERAIAYLRPAWEHIKDRNDYLHLHELEASILERAETAVKSWFGVERPHNFDPIGREVRAISDVSGVPLLGILDRVDRVEVDGKTFLYISDYKTGKPVSSDDRFLDKKFFAMRIYALLWYTLHGEMPHELRLIYVSGGTRDSVRKIRVDKNLIERARAEVKGLYKDMSKYAKEGNWPCKKHVLCSWCDYMAICPLWNKELQGLETGEIRQVFVDGKAKLVD